MIYLLRRCQMSIHYGMHDERVMKAGLAACWLLVSTVRNIFYCAGIIGSGTGRSRRIVHYATRP